MTYQHKLTPQNAKLLAPSPEAHDIAIDDMHAADSRRKLLPNAELLPGGEVKLSHCTIRRCRQHGLSNPHALHECVRMTH